MAVLISGNQIIGAKTGILAPADADMQVISNSFQGVKTAVHLYQPLPLKKLGIPANAPMDQVNEALEAFKRIPNASVEQATSAISASRLGQWLGNAEKIAKVANSLVLMAKAGSDFLK